MTNQQWDRCVAAYRVMHGKEFAELPEQEQEQFLQELEKLYVPSGSGSCVGCGAVAISER